MVLDWFVDRIIKFSSEGYSCLYFSKLIADSNMEAGKADIVCITVSDSSTVDIWSIEKVVGSKNINDASSENSLSSAKSSLERAFWGLGLQEAVEMIHGKSIIIENMNLEAWNDKSFTPFNGSVLCSWFHRGFCIIVNNFIV